MHVRLTSTVHSYPGLPFRGSQEFDSSILQDRRWNLCVKHSSLAGMESLSRHASDHELIDWLNQARSLESDAFIVHWNGHVVPWN